MKLRLLLTLLFSLSLSATVPSGARAQNSDQIRGFERQEDAGRRLIPVITPVLQAYYNAAAAGNFDAVIMHYAWDKIIPRQMVKLQDKVINAATLVKNQIDANDGIKNVKAVAVFFPVSSGRLPIKVIAEVEFNNGKKDLSPSIYMTREGEKQEWKLDFVKGWGDRNVEPPLIGLREMAANYDAAYRAILEGDMELMLKLIHTKGVRGLGKPTESEKKELIKTGFEALIQQTKALTRANGGLERIEAPDVSNSSSTMYYWVTDEGDVLDGYVNIQITKHYKNGKTESLLGQFWQHEGKWKPSIWPSS